MTRTRRCVNNLAMKKPRITTEHDKIAAHATTSQIRFRGGRHRKAAATSVTRRLGPAHRQAGGAVSAAAEDRGESGHPACDPDLELTAGRVAGRRV